MTAVATKPRRFVAPLPPLVGAGACGDDSGGCGNWWDSATSAVGGAASAAGDAASSAGNAATSAVGNAACGLGTAVNQDVVQPVTQFVAPAAQAVDQNVVQPAEQAAAPVVQAIQCAPAAVEQSAPVQYVEQAAAPVVQAVQCAVVQPAEQAVSGASDYVQNTVAPAVQQAPAAAEQAVSSAGDAVQQDVVQPVTQAIQQAPAAAKQALDTVSNALPQGILSPTPTLFGVPLCTVPVPAPSSGDQDAQSILDSAGQFLGDPGGAVASGAQAASNAVDKTLSLIQQVAPEAIQAVSPQLTTAAQVVGNVGNYIAAQTADPSTEPLLSPDTRFFRPRRATYRTAWAVCGIGRAPWAMWVARRMYHRRLMTRCALRVSILTSCAEQSRKR